MPRGNPKNLIPNSERTPEKLKEMTTKAGKKSGQVRREKKLMSQIYAEFLVKEHEVIGKDGKKKKLEGHALLSSVMSKILSRGDSASVSLFKEIREATEGNKIALSGELDCNINIVPVKSNK